MLSIKNKFYVITPPQIILFYYSIALCRQKISTVWLCEEINIITTTKTDLAE